MGFRFRKSLFPAQAGVILKAVRLSQVPKTFPRASGGDPYTRFIFVDCLFFSPRKRG